MAWPKGVSRPKPEGAGRKKGTPNKSTQHIFDLAARLGIDPIEVLLNFAKGDHDALGYPPFKVIGFSKDGQPIEVLSISEELRQRSARDVSEYMYPKRKAIELTGKDGGDIEVNITYETEFREIPKDPNAKEEG